MITKFKKGMRRATAIFICACVSSIPVFALDANATVTSSQTIAPVISTTAVAGTVLSTAQVDTAAQAIAQAAAEAAAKAAAEAAAKAAAAEAARRKALNYQPIYGNQVTYSSALKASEVITANGRLLGQYKLTFYCPCTICSGGWGNSTSSGARATEGRTIAVDPNKIPIGSHIFIEGFGDFIAEDVGSAIKGNRIDVFLNSHSRCYDLGIKYANVYIMN